MAKAQITIPLGIPDVRVLKTESNRKGEIIITVESAKKEIRCRWCGRQIRKVHGYEKWVTVRHMSVFGQATYLRYRPKRYRCEECEKKPTTTERLDWHESNSPHTRQYDEHLLLQLIHTTIEDVRIKESVSYDSVLGALERQVSTEADWSRFRELSVIGIDEIALKKGHRDYVTIVTARLEDQRVVILGVLAGRLKDTVIDFLRTIPPQLCQTVTTVCCDMYAGYIEAVRQELPQAQIVVDRFHVARRYRAGADDFRKQERKRLQKELPTEDYQKLKGSMWAFRKNPDKLTPKERKVLNYLFRQAPKLKRAYLLREQLTAIFEAHITKAKAKIKLRAWVRRVRKSGLVCFDEFIKTLQHWWEEITNYFVARESSGFVEGINNKIKVLKRRCYGIFNLQHLFQRIYLDLEGYYFFAS